MDNMDHREQLRQKRQSLTAFKDTKARAKGNIKRLKREIAELEAMPDWLPQPPLHVDVIRFNKRYSGNGKVYRYAAIRVTPGVWYVTGSTSPQQLSWEALARFIEEDNSLVPRYWHAEVVGAPITK